MKDQEAKSQLGIKLWRVARRAVMLGICGAVFLSMPARAENPVPVADGTPASDAVVPAPQSAVRSEASVPALDSQDKVMLRIVEWRTVEGEFRDWSKLAGEYTVSPAGNLSVPLIGDVEARGRSTSEIAAVIAESFQKKLGLSDKPGVSVELMAYRPFYVAGQVSAPGAYPYVPGLTVLKAVSLAGGEPKVGEAVRVQREMLNAKGQLDVLADEHMRLLIKHARIEAEMAGTPEFEAPADVAKTPFVEGIVADEKAIFSSRQRDLTLQLKSLDDLKMLLQNEVSSLEQKMKSQERQIDLAKKELASLGSLADKGLVANARILGSERATADMEGKLLDFQTEILRARQELNKATQEANSITNKAASDLATERQTVEAALAQAKLKLDTQKGLMAEAQDLASNISPSGLPVFLITYTLLRQVDGNAQEIEATENTTVLPGDVVKVTRTIETDQPAAIR